MDTTKTKGMPNKLFLSAVVIALIAGYAYFTWKESENINARCMANTKDSVISATPDSIKPENEGKLIHVTGDLKNDTILKDPVFKISANAIRLQREVSMYQWIETVTTSESYRKRQGPNMRVTKKYSYTKDWSRTYKPSANFNESFHVNPPMRYKDEEFFVKSAKLGAFTLSQEALALIFDQKQIPLTKSNLNMLDIELRAKTTIENDSFYIAAKSSPQPPNLGDLKVSFVASSPRQISVIGMQQGNSIMPFLTQCDTKLLLIKSGISSAADMFGKDRNNEAIDSLPDWAYNLIVLSLVVAVSLFFRYKKNQNRQSQNRLLQAVTFQVRNDARFPYTAIVNGERWTIRINEFPESPSLYTLLVNDKAVEELLQWPPAWKRPDKKN